ncbi:ComEA family DNA-binding protein [Candidatus Regiella endosymbiont of Tuberolachnus salignus]|uniref:ComEA family DNA-binding protein n=1 Tax=Candidatus Regiella endosymbiont of Tuberolachnus salignus TaxID=3077956 RepID=UPI0030D2E69F
MKKSKKLLILALLLTGWGTTLRLNAVPINTNIPDKNIATTASPSQNIHNKSKENTVVDTKKEPPSNRISINTATAEQLAKSLNGIGMKKAEAIVSYREQYGRFTELDQLQEVSGIGPSFLERNSAKLKL